VNLDFDVVGRSLPYLWKGFQYTVELTAIGHRACSSARCSRSHAVVDQPLYMAARVREPDAVIPLVWCCSGFLPDAQVLQLVTGGERPPQIGAERTAIITFILFEAAYFCEIMRAGSSRSQGQVHSAYALGLTYARRCGSSSCRRRSAT